MSEARTYLDHAATAPVRPAAAAALVDELGRLGNPSSAHGSGRRARRVLEDSREQLAAHLGAYPAEVVLTGGGTEADNLAVKGLFWARRAEDPRRRRVLVSAVEHHAVLDAAGWLAREQGAELVVLPVDGLGRLDLAATRAAVEEDPSSVALLSVMWANNEVGTVQPVADVAALAHEHGIPVHSDAVQAAAVLPVDLAASGVDALSTSAHKVGGPVGVGALVVRRGTVLRPLHHGGDQEPGRRSGTLDAAGARAFAVALAEAAADRAGEARRVGRLRDALVGAVLDRVPGAVLQGAPCGAAAGGAAGGAGDDLGRLPGNAFFTFPGCDGDSLLYLLDAEGVDCSAGSACAAGVARPSHVLAAMGVPDDVARGALRVSLGWTSTEADVERFVDVVGPVVARARRAAPVPAA